MLLGVYPIFLVATDCIPAGRWVTWIFTCGGWWGERMSTSTALLDPPAAEEPSHLARRVSWLIGVVFSFCNAVGQDNSYLIPHIH